MHMLKPTEMARVYGVTTRTLMRWRSEGVGPEWVRIGKRMIRYYHPRESCGSAGGDKWQRTHSTSYGNLKSAP